MNDIALANSALHDIQQKKRTSAAEKISQLLQKDADLKDNWGGVTRLAMSIGEYHSAQQCSKKYLALAPDDSKRILQTAAILAECGQLEQAIGLVSSIKAATKSPQVLHFLGTTLSQIGEIKPASEYFQQLLALAPQSAITWLSLAAIYKFSPEQPLFTKLNALSELFSKTPQPAQAPYWFALGKAQLDCGNNEQAFDAFKQGCQLVKSKDGYNAAQHKAYVDDIISCQNKEYFAQLPENAAQQASDAVFIIGLPRSGTTLLQQLLSSHSEIGLGGETRCLTYPMTEIGQQQLHKLPEQTTEQQQQVLNKIYQDYRHLSAQQFDSDRLVVDKTLDLNSHLGLITKAMPKSAIIRIRRNGEDNAWSCYRTFFNQGIQWSYDFKDIAEYFNHEQRLFQHWQQLFGQRILEISYEDLVAEPEQTLAKCFQHIGLEYQAQALNFYQNKLPVQTASVGQIRHPLHGNSVSAADPFSEQMAEFSRHYQSDSFT